MNDLRAQIYNDLHNNQLKVDEQANRYSANRILDILDSYIQPASVLDVGCGLGTWLAVLSGRGVKDLCGIDGPWLSTQNTVCDPSILQIVDLESGFNLGRRFDLAISLEVAEHLSPQAAEGFIKSLTQHSPAVLFSAAIPLQGGHHHVNEQFLSYWITLFEKHEFRPLDIIRGRIWQDQQVHWWLRQNIVLFALDELIEANEDLRKAVATTPISVVHPEVYVMRLQGLLAQLKQFKQLNAFLSQGGSFKSELTAQNQFRLTRLGS